MTPTSPSASSPVASSPVAPLPDRPDPSPDRPDPSPTVRPPWLPGERWPFPLATVAVDGAEVAVTDTGGDGPTLLFVHTGFWSFVWRDVLTALAPTFRCVALDAPGTGLSGGHDRVELAAAGAAVDAVVRDLDLRDLTLVVHDLGGPAALHAANAWPGRVRALVAVNSFGWRPSGAAFRGMLAVMGSAPVRVSDAWTGWMPRLSSGRFGVGRRWARADRRAFRRGVDRRGRRSFHRYMRSARTHDFGRVDAAVDRLADRPLLTVFGARNDPLGFQPRWAARFADTTAVTVPGGYHFPMCDAPDLVARAITGWHPTRPDR